MTAQVLRKILTRDFILLFLAQLTITTAHHMLVPTLPIYLSRLESKETEIGVLIGVYTLSSLVFRPVVGRALLKTSEKGAMIIGTLFFCLASLAYTWASPFWPFFVVRVFQGIGYAFFFTSSLTLAANISPEAHRGQSLSYFLLSMNISLALGPSFGMFLINHFSFTLFFLVCFGLSSSSLLVTKKLERRQVVPLEGASTASRLFISKEALSPSVVSFFFFFIWGALTVFFPLYAIKQGVANPGLFFTTIAVMLILSRVLAGRVSDLYSSERVILLCLITFIISMGILAFSKVLSMFILVGVIWGIGHAFFYPSLVVYLLDRVGSSRSLAMGTLAALTDLGICVGSMTMGIVVHLTSYAVMFLCLALMGTINLSYFYFYVRRKALMDNGILE